MILQIISQYLWVGGIGYWYICYQYKVPELWVTLVVWYMDGIVLYSKQVSKIFQYSDDDLFFKRAKYWSLAKIMI